MCERSFLPMSRSRSEILAHAMQSMAVREFIAERMRSQTDSGRAVLAILRMLG